MSKKSIFFTIATFFKIGYLTKAPGTLATLAALPLVYVLSLTGALFYILAILILIPVGVLAAEFYETHYRPQGSMEHDRSEIVIDEVIGIMITMTWLPLTWQSFVAGFILFRLLDIWKPFPIGYLDRKVSGGWGVIVDDMAAGLLANIILQVIYNKTSWLGSQWILA